jgi:hypothetical protein
VHLKTQVKENEGAAEMWAQVPLLSRLATRGKLYIAEFEGHALACLATGASAAEVRELVRLTATFFLAREDFQSPELRWSQQQRERLGFAADLFVFLRLSRAKRIHHYGFNGTGVRGDDFCNHKFTVGDEDDPERLK